MSEWIKVSDRLPEKDSTCLVTFETRYLREHKRYVAITDSSDLKNVYDYGQDEAVAWMYLPEPYKD